MRKQSSQKRLQLALRKIARQGKETKIYKLRRTGKVNGIPYRVYYMSCNLDHVLYNKLNSSDEDKEQDAHRFAKQYKDDIPGFLRFISESDFSVMGGYKESWQFVKEELHSLERHTNFGLCFLGKIEAESGENTT